MNHIRRWLVALAVLAVAIAGAAGWPDLVERASAQPSSVTTAQHPAPGRVVIAGQRW